MRFRLLAGTHQEGDKVYKSGQIVRSDRVLNELYKNKFDRVEDNVPSSKPVAVLDRKSLLGKKDVAVDSPTASPDVVTPMAADGEPKGDEVVLIATEYKKGQWDVINRKTMKRLNDIPLTQEQAEAVVDGQPMPEAPVSKEKTAEGPGQVAEEPEQIETSESLETGSKNDTEDAEDEDEDEDEEDKPKKKAKSKKKKKSKKSKKKEKPVESSPVEEEEDEDEEVPKPTRRRRR